MNFVSTRGQAAPVNFSEAVTHGTAPDGGLYVPTSFPQVNPQEFAREFPEAELFKSASLAQLAEKILAPFVSGDPGASGLRRCCEEAFNFKLAMPELKNHTAMLELFHGPTAAFKDFGARFLATWVAQQALGPRPLVLVATSGDTGGAVAAAFFKRPGIDVAILFPDGKVSPRQQAQLTSWGGNVKAFAVRGDFDDCQRLVKEAFADRDFRQKRMLISANSISLGRLLPQTVYYAAASLAYRARHQLAPGFVIPSGNLGNAVAALYAQQMGFPIREVVLATNANRSISDFLTSGLWQPQPTRATLANAMDVGNPSNMERLRHLFADFQVLKSKVSAFSVSDAEIAKTLKESPSSWNEVLCPHTATALNVREQLNSPHWVVVATAHPAKFESIIEPLIGRKIELPESLAHILSGTEKFSRIEADYGDLKAQLTTT